MDDLDCIIKCATKAIEKQFYKVPIDGGEPIYRERVYCYELYHQMRLRWPENSDYTLNGELDKSGHQILQKHGAANAVPDFLVHTPGDSRGNHCIIEVKSVCARSENICKDLKKIKKFKKCVGYKRGILLIFGGGNKDYLEGINKKAETYCVEFWVHDSQGKEARPYTNI